jgi:hypothetical protein
MGVAGAAAHLARTTQATFLVLTVVVPPAPIFRLTFGARDTFFASGTIFISTVEIQVIAVRRYTVVGIGIAFLVAAAIGVAVRVAISRLADVFISVGMAIFTGSSINQRSSLSTSKHR